LLEVSRTSRAMEYARRQLSLVGSTPNGGAPAALERLSDDELMLLARGGVAGAFDTLIRRHQRRVLRVAMRYLGERALAADVAQNTFVALLRLLPNYKANGRFSGLL